LGTTLWLVANRPQRENERDQCQREWRKACYRCAMQHALVMLMLALRGRPGAIRMADADLETGRSGARGELRNDRACEYRMEHERVGGDPADEPAPKSQSRSSPHDHCTPFGCAGTSSRTAQDTVQKIIA
jgi:hypothetical protein